MSAEDGARFLARNTSDRRFQVKSGGGGNYVPAPAPMPSRAKRMGTAIGKVLNPPVKSVFGIPVEHLKGN
jgi:hypothetical protein